MYNDDVKDLYKQKAECNIQMIKDFIIIYFKLLIVMPNEKEIRDKFVFMIKEWFKYDKRESEVLKYIYKEYGHIEDDLEVDEVLEILDEIFENMFNYYDDFLEGYETMLELKQMYRANVSNPSFETLTDDMQKSLIKKITK